MSHQFPMNSWQPLQRFSLALLTACAVTLGSGVLVRAKTPENNAPPQLAQLIQDMDKAANNHDLPQLLKFYGDKFTQSDGLDKENLKQILTQLWKDYPQINYKTELLSWEQQGDRWLVTTNTTIRGVKQQDGRWIHLDSTLRSQQTFQAQKLLQQNILSESTELTTGDNPPYVRVLLPETVKPGETFGFDVIVQDPLGEDILLGAALEEKVEPKNYLDLSSFELDLLPAGGIYKLVEAPKDPGKLWYSALIIRGDGMTMITRRVDVSDTASVSK